MTYLVNSKFSDASLVLAKAGAHASVGHGAWVTLIGGVTLIGVATRSVVRASTTPG
jgi:hypothetical protein